MSARSGPTLLDRLLRRVRLARLAVAREQNARLDAASKSLKTQRTELKEIRKELRRLRASVGVPRDELNAMLPVRAAAAPTRYDPDGARLDEQLRARSPAYAAAREAWQRGDRPRLIARTIGGLQFSIPDDGGADGSLSHRLAGGWLPLDDIIRVRPFAGGGVMLDIGANIGTTCIPRVVMGDVVRVFAAEPDADNYQCLVGNILDNGLAGRVLPERIAISSRDGTARLRRAVQSGGHHLLEDGQTWRGAFEEVDCLTVDTWLRRLGVPAESVGFVKVDTQGWDPHALAGATRLLGRREVVWQIEVSPSMMAAAGYSVHDLVGLVTRHFTHFTEIAPLDGRGLRPASALADLLAALPGRRRFTNLILLNATTPGSR